MICYKCPECHTPLESPSSMAGKPDRCPNCGHQCIVVAPTVAEYRWLMRAPILIALGSAMMVVILISLLLRLPTLVVFLAAFSIVPLCGFTFLHILFAKADALKNGHQEVPLFKGLGKLVLWNPTEGILLLKNKHIHYVDDNVNDGGGIRCIFPILGEEVGLRVPLTVQSRQIEDDKVFTRDSIPLDMKITVWWRVRDLSRFFLSVSRELHEDNKSGIHEVARVTRNPDYKSQGLTYAARQELEVAEQWVRTSMDAAIRRFVSGVSTSLLVAEEIMHQLPLQEQDMALPHGQRGSLPSSPTDPASGLRDTENALGFYQTATSMLSQTVQPEMDSFLGEKGISVDSISVQKAGLPPKIYEKAVDAARAWHGIIESRRKGIAYASRVQELAKVIGQDAAAATEVLKQYEGTNISVGVSGMLDGLFARLAMPRKDGGL